MADGAGVPYKAGTGEGGTPSNAPDLRAPLGAPNILRPEDFVAMANFNDPTVALTNATNLTSSLLDNFYNNRIKYAQAQADLKKTAADTDYYKAHTANIDQATEQAKQLEPLKVQQESQLVQQNKYALDEAQRQAATLDKALSEYGSWNSELSALDPTDPDYDNKVAAINAKYPEAATNPRTQSLITPMLTEHNLKRTQSDVVQQRSDQLNQVRSYVQSGLLPPDTDVRTEVNGGRGQALINQAKSQSVIHRLQTISALGTPNDRFWAQGEIGAITGKALGPGETPDRTMFTPNGDLNPGSDLVLSRIESRLGITPAAPGAKKEIKTTIDETTGQPKTETTITGMPVTQADIDAQKPKTPPDVQGAPTTMEGMQKDPTFQGIFSDIAQKKLVLPQLGTQAQTAALYDEYAKRKAAAAAGQQPAQPGPAPTPVPTSPQTAPISYQEPQAPTPIASGENRSFSTLQPDFADKAEAFAQGMRERGYEVVPIQAGRSPDYQAELHRKYLAGGNLAASPGNSFHEYGRAFDYAVRTPDGKLHMDDAVAQEAYKTGQQIASQYGLRGLGDKDNDHLEDAGYTLKTLSKEEYGVVRPRRGGASGGTQVASAQPVPSPAVPQGVREVQAQGGTGALVNSTRNKDGSISTFATNFGHDTEGNPDTYDFATLGPSARYGAWGDDLFNPQLAGVAIPRETFIAHFGNPNSKENEQLIADRKLAVAVRAPNGQESVLPIVDLGPGAKAKSQAGLDITGAGMRQLGLADNANVTYRLVRLPSTG